MAQLLTFLMIALLVGGTLIIIHFHKIAAARQGTRLRARDVLTRRPEPPENDAEAAARQAATRSIGIWFVIWLAMNMWLGFSVVGRH